VGPGRIVRTPSVANASPDPADTKFLLCAAAAQADFLVTGNKRDFPEARYGSARVVNASELLDRITREL
jgi:predicted nucleic acid-binding protein